jgi:hypothetical protein
MSWLKWGVISAFAVQAVGSAAVAEAAWTARRVAVVEGFQTPESAAVDPTSGMVYVSNVVADKSIKDKSPYWVEDGTGFISRLKPGGQLDVLQWKQSTGQLPLNAPKGICILPGELRVADITRMVFFDLAQDRPGVATPIRDAQRLNDMATDGKAVYLSDTAAGKVYRLAPGEYRVIQAPEGVNGITFFAGKMYAVSWTLHDVYQLDPTGRAPPRAFGLARHFTALDGIEVLDDGALLVSDFPGNKVSAISADGRKVGTLLETNTPADIGLDRKRLLLYVPLFMEDRVEVYQLRK